MAEQNELDGLYREAQSALKAREYDRAVGLLTQILVIDENYKDISRLLAQTVKLKRRRWYNHPATWGTLGALLLVGLGILIFPKISSLYAAQPAPATQVINPTTTPSPTTTVTPTQTLTPTPTPIPLTWKRISMGQEFPRDSVTAFATDKKDQDVLYVAMKNAGVYKTIDGGLSWRPAHYGLSSTQVESLLIDSQNPRILYAGTIGGVFKTEDGGENWFRIGDGTHILMDYQDGSHLYARDKNGIYESTDQGDNWTTVHPLNKDCPDAILSWAIHPADGDTIFVGNGEGCELGLYQSDDGGRTWVWIEVGEGFYIDGLAIGLNKQGSISIYAHYYTDDYPPDQLYRPPGALVSYDGGITWASWDTQGDLLAIDPDFPSTVYSAGGGGLFVTQGKGYPWKGIGLRTTAATAIHVDHYDGVDRIIVGGTMFVNNHDDGIFTSTDGGTSWINYKNGFGSARAELKLDPIDREIMYLAAYYPGLYSNCRLYRSRDDGNNWSEIYLDGGWCGPTFDSMNNFYLMDGTWQKTWDGGNHWWGEGGKNRQIPLPNTAQSVSANPVVDELIYSVGYSIYFSEDAGRTWQRANGSEGSWDGRLSYTDQSKMIFAIGMYHQTYSTDNGKTWQNCGQDVTASRSDTRLALDLQGERLYLATPGQGVMISTDKCGSWMPSNNGLTNLFVNTLAVDPNDANKIYAGTDGGAYISFDGGQTWGQVNDGLLGAVVVYSIVVDKDSNVYAATPYGVFKLEER